ncbi:hypothetical protein RB595_003630 [Gaeumannomyces hyphopodioides]
MKPPSLPRAAASLAVGSAAAQSISAEPSLSPSLALPGQAVMGGGVDCVAVGAAAVPGCAQECFTDGAAALGCRMNDLSCQCQQQARMMAAAESCVADFCPAVAYQSVIDGVMTSEFGMPRETHGVMVTMLTSGEKTPRSIVCACAVGAATAQPSATMGSFSAATAASSLTVAASGVPSSIAPSLVSASAAPSEAPLPRRPGVDDQRPLVATPVTPQELQLALGIVTTRRDEASSGPAPSREGMRRSLAASLLASAVLVVVLFF